MAFLLNLVDAMAYCRLADAECATGLDVTIVFLEQQIRNGIGHLTPFRQAFSLKWVSGILNTVALSFGSGSWIARTKGVSELVYGHAVIR